MCVCACVCAFARMLRVCLCVSDNREIMYLERVRAAATAANTVWSKPGRDVIKPFFFFMLKLAEHDMLSCLFISEFENMQIPSC